MDFNLTEEQTMLRDSMRDFAKERLAPLAEQADQQGFTHPEILKELGELGYCGICTPPDYGGAGFDSICYALARATNTKYSDLFISHEGNWLCLSIFVCKLFRPNVKSIFKS
jgi:Acyl-CoA dehydrogenases